MLLNTDEAKILNDFNSTLAFKKTWAFKQFMSLDNQIIAMFSGNRFGKTHCITMSYIYRFLSIHPVPQKNVTFLECQTRQCKHGHRFHKDDPSIGPEGECPKCGGDGHNYIDKFSSHKFLMSSDMQGQKCPLCGTEITQHMRSTRVYRFCAENQPNEKSNTGETFGDDGQSAETRNTLYPALKKWLPTNMIVKDITARNPNVYLKDVWGGPNIIVEFVSYNQTVQSTAGFSVAGIALDEEAPLDFYLEQLPRLIEENGDLLIGCTPANKMTYYYEDIYLRASKYIRTPSICKRFSLPAIENTKSDLDIAVIQASSYDNPILDKNAVKKMFANIAEDDQDTVNVRLYGMFSQASGRIFKDFKISAHVIDSNKYFRGGIPDHYIHGRFIDYHSHNPWACLHASISPDDEVFVWGEYLPKPDMPAKLTLTKFLGIGGKHKMRISMVDPFAEAVKKDGISVKDDMQVYCREIVASGIGTTANWQSWDTKSTRGRDQIILRLKNSLRVKRPFNNYVEEDGKKIRLPTIWILDTCPHTYRALNSWKYEIHSNPRARVTKDDKEQPQQKHSHFCCCIEAAFKTRQFTAKMNGNATGSNVAEYFKSKYR